MSRNLLHTIAIHLDIAAPLVALFFAWFRKERRLGEHVYIVAFLLIQLVLNTWIKVFVYWDRPNIYLYKANCFLSFITLSLYFLRKWKPRLSPAGYLRAATGIGSLILVILALINYEESNALNSYSYSLTALFVCTCCILYYYAKLKKPDIAKITTTRSFWFVSGLFIYYAGCFFIFLSYKFFTLDKNPHASVLWTFHNIIFVPMCTAFSIGFKCKTYHTI